MTVRFPVVAAIDIGSNTIKLTVARLGGRLPQVIESRAEVVRLSEGLALTGEIRPDRLDRAIEVLAELRAYATRLGAVRIDAVATEATRAASNGQELLDRVRQTVGIEVEVISGAEEATLAAQGVLAQIESSGRVLIVDIGGGSTELIETIDGGLTRSLSIPIGSGRMTDLHVASDPPTESELDAIVRIARDRARPFFADAMSGGKLVLVGGTGEYLTIVSRSANPMPLTALAVARELALSLTVEQMAELSGAPVARAKVLPAGFAIAQAITELAEPSLLESVPNGLRFGLLLRMSEALAMSE